MGVKTSSKFLIYIHAREAARNGLGWRVTKQGCWLTSGFIRSDTRDTNFSCPDDPRRIGIPFQYVSRIVERVGARRVCIYEKGSTSLPMPLGGGPSAGYKGPPPRVQSRNVTLPVHQAGPVLATMQVLGARPDRGAGPSSSTANFQPVNGNGRPGWSATDVQGGRFQPVGAQSGLPGTRTESGSFPSGLGSGSGPVQSRNSESPTTQ